MAAPLSDSMRRRLEKEQEAYDGAGVADETDGAYPTLPSDLAADEAMKQKGGFLQINVFGPMLPTVHLSLISCHKTILKKLYPFAWNHVWIRLQLEQMPTPPPHYPDIPASGDARNRRGKSYDNDDGDADERQRLSGEEDDDYDVEPTVSKWVRNLLIINWDTFVLMSYLLLHKNDVA